MIQFFAPDIRQNPVLPESESQHAVRVLRLDVGDELPVVDGRGMRYHCRMVDAHHKHAMVEIVAEEPVPLPWSYDLTVAIAPTKHLDRMEWLVEKLVEIGVNRIIPIRSRYSERKEIKVERLDKIAISAMKQSLKAVKTEICEMTPIENVIRDFANRKATQGFIAYCSEEIPRRLLAQECRPGTDTLILIGPEGDFSEKEIQAALAAGFASVSLGDNRLRTETAALVACDTVHIINQLQINQ